LRQIEKSTGVTPEELKVTPIPVQVKHIWDCFIDLRSAVPWDAPLSYSEVYAYSTMMSIPFSPLEVKTLMDMDVSRRKVNA